MAAASKTSHRAFWVYFFIALCLHALFLLSISHVLTPPELNEHPHQYVPAYVYRGAITPAVRSVHSMQVATSTSSSAEPTTKSIEKTLQTPSKFQADQYDKNSLKHAEKSNNQRSILDFSHQILHQTQMQEAIKSVKNTEPILLIGEQNNMADPLIKLIGRALSANFIYPSMEGQFGIQGKVIVEMVLHPEGYFSDIQIVQSSNNQDFDAAALYAVNKAPTVVGVDKLLTRPKHLVIGFVFN